MPSPRKRKEIKARRKAAKERLAEKKEDVKIQLQESSPEVNESVEVEKIEAKPKKKRSRKKKEE